MKVKDVLRIWSIDCLRRDIGESEATYYTWSDNPIGVIWALDRPNDRWTQIHYIPNHLVLL